MAHSMRPQRVRKYEKVRLADAERSDASDDQVEVDVEALAFSENITFETSSTTKEPGQVYEYAIAGHTNVYLQSAWSWREGGGEERLAESELN